jgi:hypothetical protein
VRSRPNQITPLHGGGAVVFALGLALALAACTSVPSGSGGGHQHQHGHSTTTTTSTASTSTSTSTSTTGVPPACKTGSLQLTAAFGGTAAGTSYTIFSFTNLGDPCSLEGYPTVSFYGPAKSGAAGAGPRLPITDVDSGPAAKTVSLGKRAKAEFIVVYHDVPVGGVGCSPVASTGVVLPPQVQALVLSISISVCGSSVEVYAIGAPGSEHP